MAVRGARVWQAAGRRVWLAARRKPNGPLRTGVDPRGECQSVFWLVGIVAGKLDPP